MNQTSRRFDIDALRVLAFGVLILYHIGMYYVADWHWHIKSAEQSTLLQDAMLLTNPWRMSLLFFVSGIALALVAKRYSARALIALRAKRLLIPLAFGMAVICAPQLYWQLVFAEGYSQSFWQFWPQYLNPATALFPQYQTAIGLLTWNHLWYLPYLFCYTLILLALKKPLAWLLARRWLQRLPLWLAVLGLALLLVANYLAFHGRYPSNHALVADWYNHGRYLLAMVAGFLLAGLPALWQRIIDKRWPLLVVAVLCYAFTIIDHQHWLPGLIAAFQQQQSWAIGLYTLAFSLNPWCWLLSAIGFAGRHLNRDAPWLRYANKAVLPWYMLHQTLIILAAVALRPLHLPAALEAILMLLLTVIGCAGGYEVVRRFGWLRLLFGLKTRPVVNAGKDPQKVLS
ncbi:acyltransferase family protein [Gallaecimonas mangrovi]|uniref:acyltransferase family protein n=1 Tax=Gallaecimonas mangrovi TaxID=2291597 RepID=UPI000E1FEEE3|nr:acyltransferase [Gallaecimonas mangrovi]